MSLEKMVDCNVVYFGKVDYAEGLELQRKYWEQRVNDEIPDTLLLLEHPPVITFGSSAEDSMLKVSKEEFEKRGIELHKIGRGGSVTYHGPGQLVGYLIRKMPKIDTREHLDKLEALMFLTSQEFSPEVYMREDIDKLTGERYRGVWYRMDGQTYKVGAVGIDARQQVTMHGFALNVCTENLDHFDLIDPCGLKEVKVTTLKNIAGRDITVDEVKKVVAQKLFEVFDYLVTTEPQAA